MQLDYFVVSPAYGRDYDDPIKAKNDWYRGLDFILESIALGTGIQGKYCSSRDFKITDKIEIRYNKKASLVIANGRKEK